jgi:hypothetical protein
MQSSRGRVTVSTTSLEWNFIGFARAEYFSPCERCINLWQRLFHLNEMNGTTYRESERPNNCAACPGGSRRFDD